MIERNSRINIARRTMIESIVMSDTNKTTVPNILLYERIS